MKALGLMGEQGTEAIHNHFSQLYRTYSSMANKVQRLKCIMQEHYLSVCLRLKSLRPERPEKISRKRKRKEKCVHMTMIPRICISVYHSLTGKL